MDENLDLTKILEGCPYGTEFYHSGYGKVWFIGINTELEQPIHIKLNTRSYEDAWITSEGTLSKNYNGECLLFPSTDQRDWSKFERFWDKPKTEESTVEMFDENTLKPFDKVLVRDFLSDNWMADFFEKFEESNDAYYNVTCVTSHWIQCIPYNEETKHLLGTRDDCPEYYKWWEE